MKKIKFIAYCFIVVALIVAAWTSTWTADDHTPEVVQFLSPHGVFSILPPLIAITLAFITKNVVVSLLVGVLSASYLLALERFAPGASIPIAFDYATRHLRDAVADPWNAGVLLQCGAIGGLVGLLTASGGVRAIAQALAKFARGPISSQVIAWALGFFVFFDDYANVQIRGPIMRPITDYNGVSREKFAFILDSSAAPIAGIALISTWIGTEVSYISAGLTDAGLDTISPYSLFVESIPFRFYNLLTLAFVLLTAITLREFGPMRRAELLARQGYLREIDSRLIRREDAEAIAIEETPIEEEAEEFGDASQKERRKGASLWATSLYAAIPLLALIIAAFVCFYASGRTKILEGEDAAKIEVVQNFSFNSVRACFGEADASIAIFQAAVFGGIVAFLLCVLTGKLTTSEAVRYWLSGVKSLAFTFVILILAWALCACIGKDGLGAAKFLVAALSDSTPAFLLPTMVFVLAAIVSFATGTSYGTMAIITPLAIPFANELLPGNHAFLIASTSAVLTGAIFGDHCSPISDTTILSSTSSRCGLLEHVSTQLAYALPVAAISILFGFLPVGFGTPLWIALPVAFGALLALLFIWGRKIPKDVPQDATIE